MTGDREQEQPTLRPELGWLLRPKRLLALGGFGLVAIVALYLAATETAKRLLPPIAERELANILNRDIDIGEFEQLSLGGLRLSQVVIPTAPGNENSLIIEQINVRYQPWRMLVGRLPVIVEIVGTQIAIEQLADGSWATIDLNLPERSSNERGELPIDPQIEVALREVEIAVLPLEARNPLVVEMAAKVRLRDKIETAAYEVDLRLNNGTIALQGETQLETLESQLAIAIQNLDLTTFGDLLPPDLLALDSGTVSANLQIDQPALRKPRSSKPTESVKFEPPNAQPRSDLQAGLFAGVVSPVLAQPQATSQTQPQAAIVAGQATESPELDLDRLLDKLPNIQGSLTLAALQLELAGLNAPIAASGTLQFQGDRLFFDRARAQIGALVVKLVGKVDRSAGLDVSVSLLPVKVMETIALVETLEEAMPIDTLASRIDADLTAELNVTGPFDDPTLKLSARNVTPWRLDRLGLTEFRTSVTADRDTVRLESLQLTPAAGGRIQVRGEASIAALLTAIVEPLGVGKTEQADGSQPRGAANRATIQPAPTNRPKDANRPPIALRLDTVALKGELEVDVPLDALAAPYGLPEAIALGRLQAVVDLAGTAAEPTGLVNWSLPTLAVVGEPIAATGEVRLDRQTVKLVATRLAIGGGELTASGDFDLASTDWTLRADATPIALADIVANIIERPIPVSLGLAGLSLETSGNARELADRGIEAIAARLDLSAAIADGLADVRLDLVEGAVNLDSRVSPINLSALLPELPIALGLTALSFQASGDVLELASLDPSALAANLDLSAAIADGSADVQLNLNQGEINVASTVSAIDGSALLPTLPVSLGLNTLTLNARSTLPALMQQDLSAIAADLDLNAAIADGSADVQLNVNRGVIDVTSTVSAIDLSALLPANLPLAWRGGRLELETTIANLQTIAQTQTLGGIALRGQADVNVGTGGVITEAQLNGGQLTTRTRGGAIDLAAIARELGVNLPIATRLQTLDATVDADLSSLLTVVQPLTPDEIRATGISETVIADAIAALAPRVQANLDLGLDTGSVAVTTIADPTRWSVTTSGDIPVTEALIARLSGNAPADSPVSSPALPQSASIETRLSGATADWWGLVGGRSEAIAMTLDRVALALGEEFINLSGQVQLRDILTRPDLDADLQIAANYDSDRLPLTLGDVSLAVGRHEERRREVNVAGAVDFTGEFSGRNLISEPIAPGNVALLGDLTLRNSAANDLVFDPILAGSIVARTDTEIAIDLTGESDRLMARLVPCDRGAACLSPLLPDGFELRYGHDRTEPIVALGERRGDTLDLRFENFNLDLLNLAPATKLGIVGPLQGDVTAGLRLNLFDLSAAGQLVVDRPGVGYLVTDRLQTDFSYADGTARLDDSAFIVGQTAYRFRGEVDLDVLDAVQGRLDVRDLNAILATQVRGQLTVDDGQLEDLLALFKWADIEDLATRRLGSPSRSAADLEVTGRGNPDAPLLTQLPEFQAASEAVQQLAEVLRQPGFPRDLDLNGAYDAQVEITGTLGEPEVALVFEANDWRWYVQPPINVIEPRLGFFREDGAFVDIRDLTLRASYADGLLSLMEAQVAIDDGTLSASGTVSPTDQDLVVTLDRLHLDTIRNFVPIPVDASATISAQAAIGGRPQQPTLVGEATVDDIVLNSRPIAPIASRFEYAPSTFTFATTDPDWLDIRADAPLPLTPENNTTNIAVKVKTEALELLSVLTSGAVEYVGGDLDLDLEASVGFAGFFPRIAAIGKVVLNETTVQLPPLPAAPLTVNGEINLTYDPVAQVVMDVDRLTASVAEGVFTLDGQLPLFPSGAIDTPLTFSVAQGELDLQGLYRGRVDGQVQVAGSGLRPEISGRIGIADGRVSLPRFQRQESRELVNTEVWEPPTSDTPPIVQPRFNDFHVFLGENVRAQLVPIFNFRVIGDIALNGTYNGTLDNLQAEGAVEIERGRVNALSNFFFITPGRDHTIAFRPDRSPINPYLDLEMATLVYERDHNNRQERDPDIREIPDVSVVPSRNTNQLLVKLGLAGSAQDLLAAVQASNAGDDASLIEVMSLTSAPSRQREELVALLGNQVLLISLDSVLAPLTTGVLLDVDNVVNGAGRAIGLDRLSIFPPGQIQGMVQLTPNSLLRLTYDYGWSGLQLRRAADNDGISQSAELRYEVRF